jgi:heme exporter protein D
MAGAMHRTTWFAVVVWLAVVALVVLAVLLVTSVVKGHNILADPDKAERHRGIDMIAAIDAPRSWEVPGGRGSRNDEYFPANSGRRPFIKPYNRWERQYVAPDWSLARSSEVFDAAARAAGWEPDTCRRASEDSPTQTRRCWKRPNFALIADFDSTDLSCNPDTQNCGTSIYVELAERTAG